MDSASIKTQYKPTWQVPVSLFMERARRKHEGWNRPPLLFHPSCVQILEISPIAQKNQRLLRRHAFLPCFDWLCVGSTCFQ